MKISRDEFLDIMLMASHMAGADGSIDVSEKKVMVALFKSIGITPQEQAQIKKRGSLKEAMSHLREDAKILLIDVLLLIASADGKFEKNEREFVLKVMKKINMQPKDHPCFRDNANIDLPKIRSNIKHIVNQIGKLCDSSS